MEQQKIGIGTRVGSFFVQCKRVWQVLRKPTNEEFKLVSKVSAIGLIILGAIGFIISDIIKFIK